MHNRRYKIYARKRKKYKQEDVKKSVTEGTKYTQENVKKYKQEGVKNTHNRRYKIYVRKRKKNISNKM
jgi:hypothetical protein